MTLKQWIVFHDDAKLCDSDYTRREAVTAFAASRTIVIDEVKDIKQMSSINFVGFLEGITTTTTSSTISYTSISDNMH